MKNELKKLRDLLISQSKVVLIEDVTILKNRFEEFFKENFGIDVIAPNSYEEAKLTLEKGDYGIVILDIELSFGWVDAGKNTGVDLLPFIKKEAFVVCSSTKIDTANSLFQQKHIDLPWSKDNLEELGEALKRIN